MDFIYLDEKYWIKILLNFKNTDNFIFDLSKTKYVTFTWIIQNCGKKNMNINKSFDLIQMMTTDNNYYKFNVSILQENNDDNFIIKPKQLAKFQLIIEIPNLIGVFNPIFCFKHKKTNILIKGGK